jgi:RHS repeat-associated protein
VYDGWNPVAEYSISNNQYSIFKSFTWGMDLSGTLQGAGGVGGLLMVSEISNSQISNYYPTYDGNGNVSEYLDSTGAVVAHYEYDPFGKTTVASGSKAQDFSHRFSTKPLDLTTGLYYYGYRYYDPVTGRWPSRDPIEENGGVNLYSMVTNDVLNAIDVLGAIPYIGEYSAVPKKDCCNDPKPVNVSFAFDWSPRTRPLDKKQKHDELPWFKRIANSREDSTPNQNSSGESGKDLMNALYNASKNCHCIKTLTTAGHGGGAGSSLDFIESPRFKKDSGFYVYPRSPKNSDGTTNSRYDPDNRSIEDLKNQIKWNGIRFCDDCLIQVHQCRSSGKLVQELSKATGCRVVAAAGGCHGKDYSDPNIWISDGGQWIESKQGGSPNKIGNTYIPK